LFVAERFHTEAITEEVEQSRREAETIRRSGVLQKLVVQGGLVVLPSIISIP
jgi:hypothetical protein